MHKYLLGPILIDKRKRGHLSRSIKSTDTSPREVGGWLLWLIVQVQVSISCSPQRKPNADISFKQALVWATFSKVRLIHPEWPHTEQYILWRSRDTHSHTHRIRSSLWVECARLQIACSNSELQAVSCHLDSSMWEKEHTGVKKLCGFRQRRWWAAYMQQQFRLFLVSDGKCAEFVSPVAVFCMEKYKP